MMVLDRECEEVKKVNEKYFQNISLPVFDILKEKTYTLIAFSSALFMFFLLPYIQTFGVATDLWYSTIPPLNLGLFLIFIGVFGIFVSFQVYRLRGPKVCKPGQSTATGLAGTVFGFFIGVCPACISSAGLILPLSVVTTLVVFGPLFIAISIGLMILGIYMNGGLKNNIDKRKTI